MIVSAVLFLIVVVLLRLSGGFLGDNVVRIVGAITGGNAENIPLLDFSSIDVSWLNPANWSLDGITEGINEWLHEVVDSVLPAMINTLSISMFHVIVIARTNILSATAGLVKITL